MSKLRNRPASIPTSAVTIVATAIGVLAIAVALTWFAIVAPRGVPGVSYRYLDAQFADASNVPVASEVRIAGRRVGQVTRTERTGGLATLRLQLEPDTEPMRSGTTARIRLKGLLGGKFVELTPGSSGPELADGATLPVGRTSNAADLLDVIQGLDEPTRVNLQSVVRGLGNGLAGRGRQLNDMLRQAPAVFAGNTAFADAVLDRDGAAARLAPASESLAAAFEPVRAQLAAGFRPGARVLQAFADRRAELRSTVELAPSTLSALRQGLDAATPLLNETEGLARGITRLSRPAPAALREARVLLRDARPPLRRTPALLRSVQHVVSPTLRLLRRADPVVPPSARALRNSLPPLAELGRRPCELFSFARNWRSMLSFGVAPGSGDPLGDLDDDAGLGQLNSLRTVLVAPRSTEGLTVDARNTDRPGSSAYPAPCQADEERLP